MSEEKVNVRGKRTKYTFTDEQFVDTWQDGNSAQEVADKLSVLTGQTVPLHVVSARKANYVKKGVLLKSMGRTKRTAADVESLNQRINGKKVEVTVPEPEVVVS